MVSLLVNIFDVLQHGHASFFYYYLESFIFIFRINTSIEKSYTSSKNTPCSLK